MAKNKFFPQSLYVEFEKPENGDGYYVAYESPEGAAEIGVKKQIAIYKLERVVTVSTNTTLT